MKKTIKPQQEKPNETWETKIVKCGNSLAVIIPKNIKRKLHLKVGDNIKNTIELQNYSLITLSQVKEEAINLFYKDILKGKYTKDSIVTYMIISYIAEANNEPLEKHLEKTPFVSNQERKILQQLHKDISGD